jgi:FAD/FMN-containing dehydrogenase
MPTPFPASLASALRTLLGAENFIESGDSLASLSQDFNWYSPVLKTQLAGLRADAIARPESVEELRAVVAACYRAGVAITPRGGGTGNYGQCVPLHGGVVVDLVRLNRIHAIADGVVRAEPGTRLSAIETAARAAGWEMRCMPSTWMKATLGGFLSGGSGGIGGIRWGGIRADDNVKSVTLLSCEAEPRFIRFEEEAAHRSLRTYGTTGLMVEIEIRLAPAIPYDQLAFCSSDWERLLDWNDAAARNGQWRKRLIAQFEWPIPSFFKPLRKFFREGEHVGFLLSDQAQTAEVIASAEAAGIGCVFHKPLADPPKPPFLTDYTWNHTTLWAIQHDPGITYLQAGFGPNFRDQLAALKRHFPGEILMHLEWLAADPKRTVGPGAIPEAIIIGSIPLVFYRDEARLNEIAAFCADIGVGLNNPHTIYVEDGGRHVDLPAKLALKTELDPSGLLNPGKMRTHPCNPFATRSR